MEIHMLNAILVFPPSNLHEIDLCCPNPDPVRSNPNVRFTAEPARTRPCPEPRDETPSGRDIAATLGLVTHPAPVLCVCVPSLGGRCFDREVCFSALP